MNSGKVGRRAAILRATVGVAVFRWHEAAFEWPQCALRAQIRRLRNVTGGSKVPVLRSGDVLFRLRPPAHWHASNDRTIEQCQNPS